METAALKLQVERSLRAFIDQRRNYLDEFLERNFGFARTLLVFWRTARTDVIRHPLNFMLALPFLFLGKISGWLDKFGFYEAAKLMQRLPTRIRTTFERAREQQILSELLGLSSRSGENALVQQLQKDGLEEVLKRSPKLRSCFEAKAISKVIASPLSDFSSTRSSILELASSGLTIAAGYLLFGNLSLSAYDMGRRLADSEARSNASSRFFLGPRAGSLFYHLFPTHPTAWQIAIWSAAVILGLGVLTTLINVLSDPVQQWLGIHRRHLSKFLNACQDRMVLYAVNELHSFEISPSAGESEIIGSVPVLRSQGSGPLAPGEVEGFPFRPSEVEDFPFRPSEVEALRSFDKLRTGGERKPSTLLGPNGFRTWSRTSETLLSTLGRKVVFLLKQLLRAVPQVALRLEARIGRKGLWGLLGVFVVVVLAAAGWIYRQRNPYLEVQELVERKAYVTAVARLDHLRDKAKREKEGDYWYWRGRALAGNRALDPAMDAYRSAILRNSGFRDQRNILQDTIDAAATKNHEKAKQLILQEIGPAAIDALLEKATSKEDIHRWTLVDLVKKLGGESKVRFDKIAIVDLEAAVSCPAKKRAVEKVMEYRVQAAIAALHQLEGQPQFRCLQTTLRQAIAQLEPQARAP